ncbi:MAG TPA: single-stranded DNA-binding protein [Actinomycetota bacterium]|jgi:single-strand DNA-binding protein|nr:single-stranded DNA-binding protein [Actinomycetota bacterium]
MSENSVTLVGNLTDDPELRFTAQGAAVANFRIAVSKRIRDPQTNEWKDGDTSFFRVNVWRQLAENVAESLTRGTRVIVTGTLKMRQWETQEGEKRSVVEVEATEVGPSLKWATAKMEKTSRQSGGQASSGGGDWDSPTPVPEEVPF